MPEVLPTDKPDSLADKTDSFEGTREAKTVRWVLSWRCEEYQRICGTNTGYLSVRLRVLVVVLQALIRHTLDKCCLTSRLCQ